MAQKNNDCYIVYQKKSSPCAVVLPESLYFTIWRPSANKWFPPGMSRFFLLWTMFHWLQIFKNSDYSIVYIHCSDHIVHRSCAVPAYFRWPFMNNHDLQISSTWTHPQWRGKGLAVSALSHITNVLSRPNRKFWYVTRSKNISSIRVCQKAGFYEHSKARRVNRFGLRLLGSLELEDTLF